MAQVFACPICATFVAPSLPYLLSHLRLVHSHDPRFNVACGLDGCTYSARSFSALYSHIYRKHQTSGAIQPRHLGDSSLRERNSLPIDQSDGHSVSSINLESQPPDYHMQQENQFGEFTLDCTACTSVTINTTKLVSLLVGGYRNSKTIFRAG